MQSEADIRAGAPLYLFTIDGERYEVPPLSMNKADAWTKQVNSLSVLESAIVNADGDDATNAAIAEYNSAVMECVIAYSENLDCSEVRNGITAQQVACAFQDMKDTTSPFEMIQRRSLEEMKEKMKGLPGAIGDAAIKTVIKKRLPSLSQTDS